MKNGILWIMTVATAMMLTARGAELTAEEIVSKSNDASFYAGKDGIAKVKMSLSDGRMREFTILRKNVKGSKDQKYYVYFQAPADVRKMSYLVKKHVGGDDDRWLFLPALNLVKRIAPGDKRTSFAGSDFLYEDVSGRDLNEDTHELVETTDTQYVVKYVPKNPKETMFSSYTSWIDKITFIAAKTEYLNKNGKLYRKLISDEVKEFQGHPTATHQVAEDLLSGSKTEIKFSGIKFDIGLNDRIFTERFLRRPPRQVTR